VNINAALNHLSLFLSRFQTTTLFFSRKIYPQAPIFFSKKVIAFVDRVLRESTKVKFFVLLKENK